MTPPPLVEPDQRLTADWALTLPFPMARRVEDGSLVFWHAPKGLTFWIDAYDAPDAAARLLEIRAERGPHAIDEVEERDGALVRYGYALDEGARRAFYGHVLAPGSWLLIAAYHDDPASAEAARATWRSVRWTGAGDAPTG